MKPVIHSTKHYVQMSRFTVTANAAVTKVIIDSTDVAAKTDVFEVEEGAVVKAVFIELWAEAATIDGSTIVALIKMPSNLTNITFAQLAALGNYDNKKNVLFFHQGLAADDGVSGPYPLMKGWYKIPKSKQRFGLSDRLVIATASQTPGSTSVDFCGFATYKEYT